MRILITGSSGQIGTNLGLALLQQGHVVLGIDVGPNKWTDAIETHVVDLVAVARGLAEFSPPWRPDCVVHLAAHAKVYEVTQAPAKALENVEMTWAALELARQSRSPIVLASSREVYGDVLRHVTDETLADFVIAESPYSASKIGSEAFVYSYARCYSLPTLVFRFSNVYGRYDNDLDRMERVIPLFVHRIARGEPITVFGRSKVLDFTFVDDCVQGVIAGVDALTSEEVVNETINLAYGQGWTLFDLVNLIELSVGKKADASYEPSRVGEVTRYVADIAKARALLSYDPQVPLSLGIPMYVDWCRESGLI